MFVHPLRGALAKERARAGVKRDGTICAKNSTFGYFVGANPITGEGNQLRSPTPIMAPVDNHQIAKYSRTPLFRSPKGNGKKFEIAGFRNNREA